MGKYGSTYLAGLGSFCDVANKFVKGELSPNFVS